MGRTIGVKEPGPGVSRRALAPEWNKAVFQLCSTDERHGQSD